MTKKRRDEMPDDLTADAVLENPPVSFREPEISFDVNPPAVVEAEPPKMLVELRVFLASGWAKPDQMAGFKAHARANHLGPRSLDDWRVTYRNFWNKPIR